MSKIRGGLAAICVAAISLFFMNTAGFAQVTDAFEGSGGTAPSLAGWTIDPAVGGVGWKVDGLDGPVGPGPGGATLAGLGSLNYNDDVDYDNLAANTGSATSPAVSPTGGAIVVTFGCNYETESTGGTFDQRFMEIVDPGTGLVVAGGSFQVFGTAPAPRTCAAMGTWHGHTIDVTAAVGALTSFRVRFRMSTGDSIANAFDGWFVDNLSISNVAPPAPPPPPTPLPYLESFDGGGLPTGWSVLATSPTVAWDVDALPTPVGPGPDGAAFSGVASLNYNDDVDFDSGAANSGSATSPELDTSGSGGTVIVSFMCNYETETTSTGFDARSLQVLDGSTLAVIATRTFAESGDSNPPDTTCSPMGTYHIHTMSIPIGAATSVRIRFNFNTLDAIANTFDGWFVDDLSVCADTVAPTTPTNLIPLDGTTVSSPPGVLLDWSDATDTNPCGPATVANYVVEVDDDPAFASIDFTASPAASTATTGVLAAGTYFWRVRAVDASGNVGADSTVTSFNVEAPLAPSAADTLFVNETVDGAQSGEAGFVDPVVDESPVFSAIYRDPNTMDTAVSLRFQVSSDATFTILDFDSGTTPLPAPLPKDTRCPDLSITASLLRDTVYFWRLQFTDAGGLTGPFCPPQSFRIGDDFDFGVRHGSTHHGRRCYVATAAFGSGSPEVASLQQLREGTLAKLASGRIFSRWYATAGASFSCMAMAHPSEARMLLAPLGTLSSSPAAALILVIALAGLLRVGVRRF